MPEQITEATEMATPLTKKIEYAKLADLTPAIPTDEQGLRIEFNSDETAIVAVYNARSKCNYNIDEMKIALTQVTETPTILTPVIVVPGVDNTLWVVDGNRRINALQSFADEGTAVSDIPYIKVKGDEARNPAFLNGLMVTLGSSNIQLTDTEKALAFCNLTQIYVEMLTDEQPDSDEAKILTQAKALAAKSFVTDGDRLQDGKDSSLHPNTISNWYRFGFQIPLDIRSLAIAGWITQPFTAVNLNRLFSKLAESDETLSLETCIEHCQTIVKKHGFDNLTATALKFVENEISDYLKADADRSVIIANISPSIAEALENGNIDLVTASQFVEASDGDIDRQETLLSEVLDTVKPEADGSLPVITVKDVKSAVKSVDQRLSESIPMETVISSISDSIKIINEIDPAIFDEQGQRDLLSALTRLINSTMTISAQTTDRTAKANAPEVVSDSEVKTGKRGRPKKETAAVV